jgi:hypothetical protein
MTHLDEGTIHAWLDGALSATEAGNAESHVTSCAECSAKVAEARGFIAGASRILTSLDDVPAVTPKRAPSTAPSRPAVRQWRAAPWVTGIAATLMLAIGITTFTREDASTKLGERLAVSDSGARGFRGTPAVAPAPPAPAPATVQPVASTRRDDVLGAQTRRASAREPQAQLRSAVGAGGASGAGAVQDLASGTVSGRAPTQVASAPQRAEAIASRDTVQQKAAVTMPAAGAPAPAPAVTAAFKEAASADAVAKLESTSDAAGCYPIAPQLPTRALAEAATPTAAKAASADRRRAATPAGAPVAAMNRAAEESVLPPLPSTVLLDTTRTVQGYLVRSPANRVALGFWQRVGDSVRVNLLMHGVHTIATSKRANCP